VGDVASDANYLTALPTTQSEIIIPVLSAAGDKVLGTIDVESERPYAFDASTQSWLEECANVLRAFWEKGQRPDDAATPKLGSEYSYDFGSQLEHSYHSCCEPERNP
jgi:hypothetical protein